MFENGHTHTHGWINTEEYQFLTTEYSCWKNSFHCHDQLYRLEALYFNHQQFLQLIVTEMSSFLRHSSMVINILRDLGSIPPHNFVSSMLNIYYDRHHNLWGILVYHVLFVFFFLFSFIPSVFLITSQGIKLLTFKQF